MNFVQNTGVPDYVPIPIKRTPLHDSISALSLLISKLILVSVMGTVISLLVPFPGPSSPS